MITDVIKVVLTIATGILEAHQQSKINDDNLKLLIAEIDHFVLYLNQITRALEIRPESKLIDVCLNESDKVLRECKDFVTEFVKINGKLDKMLRAFQIQKEFKRLANEINLARKKLAEDIAIHIATNQPINHQTPQGDNFVANKQFAEAVAWFKKTPSPRSNYNLGRIYRKGEGDIKEDWPQAWGFYLKAKDQEEDFEAMVMAKNDMAYMLTRKDKYPEANAEKALELYTELAEEYGVQFQFPNIWVNALFYCGRQKELVKDNDSAQAFYSLILTIEIKDLDANSIRIVDYVGKVITANKSNNNNSNANNSNTDNSNNRSPKQSRKSFS
jgi:hypothetical protein